MPAYAALPSGILAPATIARAYDEMTKAYQRRLSTADMTAEEKGVFFSTVRRALGYSPVLALEKPADEPTHAFLRRVEKKSAIDKVILTARLHQMRRVAQASHDERELGIRIVHDRHTDDNFDSQTPEIEARIKAAEKVLMNPYREVHSTYKDALLKMTRDELILDRKVMVISRGRHGRPVRWHLIDPATVKPRIEILRPWMLDHQIFNEHMAAELMSYERKIDLTKAAWVQEVDGNVVAAWKENEISVDITNPINEIDHWGYGKSLLEESLELTDLFMKAWMFNSELFKTNYPEAIMVVYGDVDEDGLEKFKRKLYAETSQGGTQRLPVIEGGDAKNSGFDVKTHKLRDTPKEMMFTEMLRMIIALKCAAFRMHPGTINFGTDQGGTALFDHRNEEEAIDLAQEEGFHSLLMNVAEWFTRAIVKQIDPELKCIWEGLEKEDDKRAVEIIDKEVRTYRTVNEIRKSRGHGPLPNGEGDIILDATFLQARAQRQQMEMQQQMAQQQAGSPQGDFGEESEEDQDFWANFGQRGGGNQDTQADQEQPGQGEGQGNDMGDLTALVSKSHNRLSKYLTIEVID